MSKRPASAKVGPLALVATLASLPTQIKHLPRDAKGLPQMPSILTLR